jgi:hypothetical protein
MERWAANTLRTLGIILTAGFVLVTSLLLLLLSMCAAQGGAGVTNQSGQVVPFLLGAVAVLVLGIWFIVWLARGIFRSGLVAEPVAARVLPPSEPASSVPLHLSPLGRKAIDRLVFALGAQIVLSALAWIFNQLHFWTARLPYARQNWTLALLAPYILYHLPYAILIYVLLKKPDRRTFAYSLAVPAVMILQAVFSLGVIGYYFVHQPQGFLLLVLPWLIHIVILVLAYQAIQQVGLHPEPSSILIAAVATFAFFSLIHVITPFLYRFMWR